LPRWFQGEFDAVDLVSRHTVSSIIFIVFTPLKGTPMANMSPPSPGDVATVFTYARKKLPSLFQSLGCVRPLHRHREETDILALKAGVNGIVYPTREAIMFARRNGLDTEFLPLCCSLAGIPAVNDHTLVGGEP